MGNISARVQKLKFKKAKSLPLVLSDTDQRIEHVHVLYHFVKDTGGNNPISPRTIDRIHQDMIESFGVQNFHNGDPVLLNVLEELRFIAEHASTSSEAQRSMTLSRLTGDIQFMETRTPL